MNYYKKFDDRYNIYYPVISENCPKTIELEGKMYYRFMNYFYIPEPVYELNEDYVKFINDLRYNFKDIVIDCDYNNTIELEMFKSISKHIELNGHIELLDFGCGEGALGNFFNEKIKSDTSFNIHGIDIRSINPNLLSSYKSFNIVTLSQDLPFNENYFDIAIALFVFHFKVSMIQLKSLYKILKPNGVLCFNLINCANKEILNRLEQVGFKQTKSYNKTIDNKHVEYYIYIK